MPKHGLFAVGNNLEPVRPFHTCHQSRIIETKGHFCARDIFGYSVMHLSVASRRAHVKGRVQFHRRPPVTRPQAVIWPRKSVKQLRHNRSRSIHATLVDVKNFHDCYPQYHRDLFRPILFGRPSSRDTTQCAIAKSGQLTNLAFVPHRFAIGSLRIWISLLYSPSMMVSSHIVTTWAHS
jgi:hypothetical protein